MDRAEILVELVERKFDLAMARADLALARADLANARLDALARTDEIAALIRRRADRLLAVLRIGATEEEDHHHQIEGLRPMAVPQSVLDALRLIDDATNKVAAVITALRDKIKTSMTQQDVDDVKARLTAVADHLTAVAADPDNPVPPPPTP